VSIGEYLQKDMSMGAVNDDSVVPSWLRGPARRELLKAHRLIEFEKTLDAYFIGHANADDVKRRARKMLEVGLPILKKRR